MLVTFNVVKIVKPQIITARSVPINPIRRTVAETAVAITDIAIVIMFRQAQENDLS